MPPPVARSAQQAQVRGMRQDLLAAIDGIPFNLVPSIHLNPREAQRIIPEQLQRPVGMRRFRLQ